MNATKTARKIHVFGRAPKRLQYGTYLDTLSGGNHHPLLCALETENGEPDGNWVVKPQVSVTMGNRRSTLAILSELASADMCARVGIMTPEVGLMTFPTDISDEDLAGMPQEARDSFVANRGLLAFCSRHLEGALDLNPEAFRNAKYLLQTLRRVGPLVMLLDAYLWHDDRTVANPNALLWQWEIVAIDHGSAFSTLGQPRSGAALAAMTVIPEKRIKAHVFYGPLHERRRDNLDFDSFSSRVSSLQDHQIEAMYESWPVELDEPTVSNTSTRAELREFLRSRRSVVTDVVDAVKRVVGV